MPRLLKLSEVAEILSCSLANCYALCDCGDLPAIPVGANGKGLRVSEDDLREFIESRKTPTLSTRQQSKNGLRRLRL
jgi:predicted DNA-binding transcriptional regulator AlpA